MLLAAGTSTSIAILYRERLISHAAHLSTTADFATLQTGKHNTSERKQGSNIVNKHSKGKQVIVDFVACSGCWHCDVGEPLCFLRRAT